MRKTATFLLIMVLALSTFADDHITLSQRQVPIAYETDVLIIGGTTGAIGAAVAAADSGSRVLLVSPNYYLATDISSTYRYWLESDETPQTELATQLFNTLQEKDGYFIMQPGKVKRAAEDLLQNSGVEFLYKTCAVNALFDNDGNCTGAVITNKAGRQAVLAKVIIDATTMSGFARIAEFATTEFKAGDYPVMRVRAGIEQGSDNIGNFSRHTLNAHFESGSWVERCNAEKALRQEFDDGSATWAAQRMFFQEPNRFVTQDTVNNENYPGADSLDLNICRPENSDNFFILGAMAGVSPEHATQLIRPLEQLTLGQRVGALAHNIAQDKSISLSADVASSDETSFAYEIKELLSGHRPAQSYTSLALSQTAIPVWGDVDVLVVGGGASGAPAAIAAARKGANVLVTEMLGMLGGTGVNGIGKFWRGNRTGFAVEYNNGASAWKHVHKANWLFQELVKAGGDVWFNTLATGVVMDGNRVRGVLVSTPIGSGVVLAKTVIDATGDGDIAAAAGAEFIYVNDGDLALQESSYLGDSDDPSNYVNEFESIFADPIDIYSITMYHVLNRRNGVRSESYDFYPLAGVRESRLIRGDVVITPLDQYVKRGYHDVIAKSSSDFDSHSYFNSDAAYAGVFPNDTNYIPYRSLLPKGLNGILVVGRCKSTVHDAQPLTRMQSDVANEGYAAGYIAAMCAEQNSDLREADIPAAQQHLVEIGNMTASSLALKSVDPEPLSVEDLTEAIEKLTRKKNIAYVLANPQKALQPLRDSFANEPTQIKAKLLCMLGDTTGVPFLADWLDNEPLGEGLYYSSVLRQVKEVDGVIWALGLSGDPRAVPALTKKLDACPYDATIMEDKGPTNQSWGESNFSHIRALTMALAKIGDPSAVEALDRFLQRDLVKGHVKKVDDANAWTIGKMLRSIIELHVVSAMYCCGDATGEAEQILNEYLNDWRGPIVRFAATVLSNEAGVPSAVQDQLNITPQHDAFVLYPNYPNPFNPETRIRYFLYEIADVNLQMYNALGQKVRTLVQDRAQETGLHTIVIDSSDLASGQYFVTLTVNQETHIQKIMLVK